MKNFRQLQQKQRNKKLENVEFMAKMLKIKKTLFVNIADTETLFDKTLVELLLHKPDCVRPTQGDH